MKLRAINLPSQTAYGRPEGQRANAFHRRKRMPFADFRSSPDVSGLRSARDSKHTAQASALPLAHGDSRSDLQPQVLLAEASLPRAALKARQVQGRGEERPAGALGASSGSGDSRGPSQEPGQASSKPFAAGGPGWLEEASTPLGSASEAGSPTFTTSADGGSRFPQQQPRPAQQASTAVPTDRPFAAGPGGTWLEVASTPLGRPGAADPTPPTVPHTVAAQRPTVVRAEAYAKPAKRRGFTIGWLDFSGPDLSGLGPRGATYEILRRPGKKKVVQTAQEFKEEGSALLEGVVEDPARIVTSLEPTERPYAADSGPSNWLEAASKPIGRQPGAGDVGRIGVSQGTPAAVPSRSPGSLEGTARTISSTEASKRPFAAGDAVGWREAASTPQGAPARTSPTEYLGKPFAAGDNVPSWLEAASTPLGGYKAPEGGATFTSTPRSAPHQGKVTARPGSLSTVTPRLVGSTGERAAEAISRTEPALRPFAAGPGSGNWLEAASTPIGARRIPIDSIKSAYRPAPQPSGILAVRPGSAAKVASKNPVSGEVAAKAISSTEPSRRPYAAGPGGGWLETASRPLGAGPSRPAAPGSTVKPFAAGFDTPGWLEAASTPLGGPKAPDGGATFTVDPRTIVPTQQQGKSTSRPGSRATVTSKGAATGERAAEAISRTEASKRPFAAGPGGWLEAVSTKLGAQTAPVDGKTAPRPVSTQQSGPGVAPVSFATVTDRRPSGGEGAAKAASSADPSKRPYAAGQGGGWLDAASKPLGRPGRVLPTEFLGKPFAAGDSVPGWLEAASTPLGSYSPPAGGATFELPRPQQTTAKPVSRPGSRATVTPKKFGTWGNAGEAAVQAEPTQRPFAADLSSSTVRSPAAATKPAKPFAAGPNTPGWREAASKPL